MWLDLWKPFFNYTVGIDLGWFLQITNLSYADMCPSTFQSLFYALLTLGDMYIRIISHHLECFAYLAISNIKWNNSAFICASVFLISTKSCSSFYDRNILLQLQTYNMGYWHSVHLVSVDISLAYTNPNISVTCLDVPVESALKIEGYWSPVKRLPLQANYNPPTIFHLDQIKCTLIYTCNSDFPSERTRIGYELKWKM